MQNTSVGIQINYRLYSPCPSVWFCCGFFKLCNSLLKKLVLGFKFTRLNKVILYLKLQLVATSCSVAAF